MILGKKGVVNSSLAFLVSAFSLGVASPAAFGGASLEVDAETQCTELL